MCRGEEGGDDNKLVRVCGGEEGGDDNKLVRVCRGEEGGVSEATLATSKLHTELEEVLEPGVVYVSSLKYMYLIIGQAACRLT